MNITKNGILKGITIVAVLLNVVLAVGVGLAYHTGYQAGIEQGVTVGASLASDNTSETIVSADPGPTQEPPAADGETTATAPPNPQAGVTFDQHNEAEAYSVSVQTISLTNADHVVVATAGAGTCDPCTMDAVGETVEVHDMRPGDTLTVVAAVDGREAVIQTYTVRDTQSV